MEGSWKKLCVVIFILGQIGLVFCFLYFGFLEQLQNHGIRPYLDHFADESEELYSEVDFEDLTRFSFKKVNATTIYSAESNNETKARVSYRYPPGKKILFPKIYHKPGEIFMMVMVTTIPKAVTRREAIRRTWAQIVKQTPDHATTIGNSTNYSTDAVVYIQFMVGKTGDLRQDADIETEAATFGDILRGNYEETYRNIVVKVFYAFKWALQFKPKYILKVDDDVYAHIPRFVSWLRKSSTPKRLYAGYVHFNAYISRNPKNQHYVSKKQFPEKKFPNYCAGPCYIISGNLLEEFTKQAKKVPIFRVEDAFMGLLARQSKVKPLDIGGKLFIWDRSLRNSVRNWPDSKLLNALCLGDSLNPYTIQYLHKRFLKMLV